MSVKIMALEAENVKRIKAVALTPSPTGLTIVGGNNNQGKTSVLDALAWALGGDRFRPDAAQRDGAVAPAHLKVRLSNGVVVEGVEGALVRLSRCCNPVPGDDILGFVTRGRGVSIHRTDCVNIINLPSEERTRLIEAEWQQPEDDSSTKERYTTEIQIYANNRIGMFVDISKVFTERQIDITSMNVRTSKQGKATIIMTFDIHGIEELNRLTDKLRQIDGVIDIERTAG